jgi:hypothetical protein
MVTFTSAGPGARGPVTAVIEDTLLTETLVAGTPPMVTMAGPEKFDPPMVTVVPPEAGPLIGAIDVTRGAVPDGPPGESPPQEVASDEMATSDQTADHLRAIAR